MNRDDFDKKTRTELEYRVNCKCSNPACRRTTSGPKLSPNGFIRTGAAAHICAAAPKGKRYDPNMTADERKSISNGIWLCENCHKLIDSDEERYTVELLRSWKATAEEEARIELISGQQNLSLSSSAFPKKRLIRISVILFVLISIYIVPVIYIYVTATLVGFWGRLVYFLALVFIARIALYQIETRPQIAASCFGTIKE